MWMLDGGALGALGRIADSLALPAGLIHVSGEVAAEEQRRPGCDVLLGIGPGRDTMVRVHPLPPGVIAPERQVFQHLRRSARSPLADLGEHESIALLCACKELAAALFVTHDRHALALALNELGPGRVATPYDCWHDLHVRELIGLPEREFLFKCIERNDGRLPRPFRLL